MRKKKKNRCSQNEFGSFFLKNLELNDRINPKKNKELLINASNLFSFGKKLFFLFFFVI